jgi:hypothetical protein
VVGPAKEVDVAATHRQDWQALQWPNLAARRRRRAARLRRELTEVDVFLDELHSDLDDRQSTLVRALEGYRRKLRAGQPS